MGKISDGEVRRLISYLLPLIDDERLTDIEDELRGDFAEEYLREPDLLGFFPPLSQEFVIENVRWQLRIIPHAHLRMVQRGVRLLDISDLFRLFIEKHASSRQLIFIGHFTLVGRIKQRNILVTIRIDVDVVTDTSGKAHVVTVHMGRGNTEGTTEIDLLSL